jgi:NAD(P)-dependent dehydrogenase (short-subunit alcohol dehydrogenase family)
MTASTQKLNHAMETAMNSSNSAERKELIVVTGASTGMGAATVKELARKGFHVLAGVRHEADAEALRGLGIEGIEPCILDITVESDVAAIADRVATRCIVPFARWSTMPGSRSMRPSKRYRWMSGADSSRSICSVTSR